MKIHRDGSRSTQRVFWPVFLPNWLPLIHFTIAHPGQPAAAVEAGRMQPVPSPSWSSSEEGSMAPEMCTSLSQGGPKLLTLETYDFSKHQSSTRMGKDRKILNKFGQGITDGFRQGNKSIYSRGDIGKRSCLRSEVSPLRSRPLTGFTHIQRSRVMSEPAGVLF